MGNKITVLMGKSSSGKDRILGELCRNYGFSRFVSFTTRPMRSGEVNGVDYYFVTEEEFKKLIENDSLIEFRTYNTIVDSKNATWYYGLSKEEVSSKSQIGNYVTIFDVGGAHEFINYIGKENVNCYYIYIDDEIRLSRAIGRDKNFSREEYDRREKSDIVDFDDNALLDVVTKMKLLNNNEYDLVVNLNTIVEGLSD